jgi:hypothetical protein
VTDILPARLSDCTDHVNIHGKLDPEVMEDLHLNSSIIYN